MIQIGDHFVDLLLSGIQFCFKCNVFLFQRITQKHNLFDTYFQVDKQLVIFVCHMKTKIHANIGIVRDFYK